VIRVELMKEKGTEDSTKNKKSKFILGDMKTNASEKEMLERKRE